MDTKIVFIAHLYEDDIDGINQLRTMYFDDTTPRDIVTRDIERENYLYRSYSKGSIRGREYLNNNIVTFVVFFVGGKQKGKEFFEESKEIFLKLKINERGLGESIILESHEVGLINECRRCNKHFTVYSDIGKLEFYCLRSQMHLFISYPFSTEEKFADVWDYYYIKDLPLLDVKIYNLAHNNKFYTNQIKTIVDEKKDLDDRIRFLLNRNLAQEINVIKVDDLDDTVEELARIYGALGTNSLILEKSYSILEEGIAKIEIDNQRLFQQKDNELIEKFIGGFKKKLKEINKLDRQLEVSIKNTKAAISVIRTRIDLIRTKDNQIVQKQMSEVLSQNLNLMKEGISLQVAAAFIEFIVVSYYSLSIWKTLTDEEVFHHIPPWVKLGLIIAFAGSATLQTHYVAQALQNKDVGKEKVISMSIQMIVIIAIMIYLSIKVNYYLNS